MEDIKFYEFVRACIEEDFEKGDIKELSSKKFQSSMSKFEEIYSEAFSDERAE